MQANEKKASYLSKMQIIKQNMQVYEQKMQVIDPKIQANFQKNSNNGPKIQVIVKKNNASRWTKFASCIIKIHVIDAINGRQVIDLLI